MKVQSKGTWRTSPKQQSSVSAPRETDMINCNYLLLMNTRIRAVACYSDFQASCNAPKPKHRAPHALMCSVSVITMEDSET